MRSAPDQRAVEGERRLGPLAHLRAAFVLAHLAAVVLPSLPMPAYFDASLLDGPTGRDQLSGWARLLSVDEPRLRAAVLFWAPRLVATRRAALAPFEPYYAACGTRQGFRLFSFVDQETFGLVVDERTSEGDAPLFRPGSSEHAVLREAIEHERVRSLLGSIGVSPGHRSAGPFAAWVAREVKKARPSTSGAIVVALERRRVPPPEQARRGEEGPSWRAPEWVFEPGAR